MRKKDRVETATPYKGAIQYGIVTSVTKGKVHVILDDGVSCISGPARCFLYSNKPRPSTLTCFTKGDRVEVTDEGKMEYGTVHKADLMRVTIILDGGKLQFSTAPSNIRHSNQPYAKDTIATPMDKYEVRGYREVSGHDDSVPFVATIYRDGKRILHAENDGWGGSDNYTGHHKDVMQFEADAKEWGRLFGVDDLFEPASTWITWYVTARPYGGTAQVYLAEWQKSMGETTEEVNADA